MVVGSCMRGFGVGEGGVGIKGDLEVLRGNILLFWSKVLRSNNE